MRYGFIDYLLGRMMKFIIIFGLMGFILIQNYDGYNFDMVPAMPGEHSHHVPMRQGNYPWYEPNFIREFLI
jgi:hypothetical protein